MRDQYPMHFSYASPERMERSSQYSLTMDNGATILLMKPSISIGRSRACDVVIDDPAVSRNHAHLFNHLGQWFLCDDGSLNGTQINNFPLRNGTQYLLRDEDIISLGRRVSLVFRDRSNGPQVDVSYPFGHAEPMGKRAEYNEEEPIMGCVYASPPWR